MLQTYLSRVVKKRECVISLDLGTSTPTTGTTGDRLTLLHLHLTTLYYVHCCTSISLTRRRREEEALRAGIQRMLMKETNQLLQYRFSWFAGIWRSSTIQFVCIGCSHPWFHCLSRQPSLFLITPCTCHLVFFVGWDLLLHRFFRQTPFCKDVVLLAILPEGSCIACLIMCIGCTLWSSRSFVDDITHRVVGTRDAVMRVFSPVS